ncbi:cation diffusion facilitator family transporter [Streptococcus fryi]
MMSTPTEDLKLAERGPILSILTYLILACIKLLAGYSLGASSLVADGFNNFSDIISNVTLLIGLKMASKPADVDHKFGHWKIEDLASLLTSCIMFMIGIQILFQTIQNIISKTTPKIDPLGAAVGLLSALVMLAVYTYNKNLAKTIKSSALIAASKDNLADAVTSIGTSFAILASWLHFPLIDQIVAFVITLFILKTAYDIFAQASFSLSDGFNEETLHIYEEAILQIPKITTVKSQRGRTYGSNVYLDIVLEMHPDLSVYESHAITEKVEELLRDEFGVYDIDIHVEPSALPEDEIFENVYKKLLTYEKMILSKLPDYDQHIHDNFYHIESNGEISDKQKLVELERFLPSNIEHFSFQTISQKTKLLTYELNNEKHTSIWRRHEIWQVIYHQTTKIES